MTVFEGPAMVVPETAQPIFNPLKGLADALQARRVSIAPLLFIDAMDRISHPGSRQFGCTVQEDFSALAEKIAELGKVVRFIQLVAPRIGIIATHSYRHENIWARYVVFYDVGSDQMVGRWDVLVEAAS